jgi:hypothetical protein
MKSRLALIFLSGLMTSLPVISAEVTAIPSLTGSYNITGYFEPSSAARDTEIVLEIESR